MARVGGRNTVFAWFVGIVCAAAVGTLLVLAIPMFPVMGGWVGDALRQASGTPAAETDAAAPEADAAVRDCRDLYEDPLWASLVWEDEALLTQDRNAPVTSATALVDALQPVVTVSCDWSAAAGAIATTLATVPVDAGAVAATALPTSGFTCEVVGARTRCERTEGELRETIETGDGVWLSTSQTAWHPAGYADRIAERVFAG